MRHSRSTHWWIHAAAVVLAPFFITQQASANGPPIHGESGFVTGLNGAAVRSFGKTIRKSSPTGEVTAFVVPVVVPYEVADNKLVIGIGLPLVSKSLELNDGMTRSAGLGIGDLFVFGKFNLYQKDAHQQTLRIAGKLGLTFPTGLPDAGDSAGTLPPPLQRGTGSVNPSVMLIGTRLWRRVGISADVGYTALPEASNLDRGDRFQYDVAGSFRLLPRVFETYPDHQLNAIVELNGVRTDRSRLDGARVADSGGHELFVSPGLQYMYSTLIVEASVQLPVPGATSLNGAQLEPDWTALLGVRWLIF